MEADKFVIFCQNKCSQALTRFLLGSLRLSCAASTYPALDGGQQVKYLRETDQRKKVKILSSNWNCPNQYFQIKTIPSSKIERVVGAEFPEPPTSSFLTSSWIGTQVLDIINKYKNRKGEKVKNKIIWKTRRWASCKKTLMTYWQLQIKRCYRI